MKKPKLNVYEVKYRRVISGWTLTSRRTLLIRSSFETKRNFVSRCAAHCRNAATEARPISLRIRSLDGRILEERTYPRSADPRRSKG